MTKTFELEFDLGDVVFERVPASEVEFLAASDDGDEGELLRFRNAVLARAEVNKNRDGLTAENIDELADTLPLMPINVEHEERTIVGFFTSARNIDNALVVDGIIFARRFPEIVKDVVDGLLKLSIEGVAKAIRMVNGVRWFERLKAVGGALTEKPAGSNTGFHNSSMLIIASEQEESEDSRMDEIQELKEKLSERDYTIAELEAKVEELEASRTETQASLEAAQSEATVAREEAENEVQATKQRERLSAQRAAQLLASGHSQDQIDEIWDELGTVSDKVFAMMASNLPQPEEEEDEASEDEDEEVEASEEDAEEEDEEEADPVVTASVSDADNGQDDGLSFEFV